MNTPKGIKQLSLLTLLFKLIMTDIVDLKELSESLFAGIKIATISYESAKKRRGGERLVNHGYVNRNMKGGRL